ncbi:Shedu anti-phage system protein SduA domain-containing protein [Carnobacterium pleistocenium]|uniref:Shedu anti-phage system protein SduA domain-containing protein n=1 Tax=Carnobacterium pleistocenium TaxID=181073 RepID=UPI0005540258|nr:Shedu anti-phage system protein SduA domain-containing protein [Carnobacterium pleistocenium]
MYNNSHQILMGNLLKNLTSRTKSYLIENKSYLKELDFDIKADSLGIDIIFAKEDNNFLINFNNEDRLSYNTFDTNPFYIRVENAGIARLSNVTINNVTIDKGFIVGKVHYNFFLLHTEKFMDSYIYSLDNPIIDKKYKIEILNQFESLLKENPKELKIDKFIEKNPFILELSLHLTDLQHQVTLLNIEEEFEQNLRPDVIAYKPLDKRWYIVDYKRAERSLLKNSGKVRSGFLAEVNSLTNQLSDYIDYFTASKMQTKYIKEKYDIHIKYPKGIGIIGDLNPKDEEAYLKATRNLPREIEVYPYNYMVDECRRVLAFN